MDAETLSQKLTSWITEKVTAAGCRGVVLGMSGGLDSSVLGALCIRAFPRDTLGVIMPCHSIDEDKAHALAVAGKFAIPTVEVCLDGTFDTLLRGLPGGAAETATETERAAGANLKARLRMATLYYAAAMRGYLVAGSSNRTELTIGYFTKHGDSGVDILPLGNLVKREVREIARHLEIPAGIIDKPPSAGLWEGQTDEAEMGITYELLDRYIREGDAPADVRSKIEAMIAASDHKRAMPPIAE